MGFWETFFSSLGGTAAAVGILGYLGRSLLDNRLKKDLEEHKTLLRGAENALRIQQNEAASIRETVKRYSRVIMISAEDAQDRLWHLCERQARSKNKVLDAEDDMKPMYGAWPMTKRHYLLGTLYLIARYLCWVEILKAQIRLLEFNDDDKTSAFHYHLKRVERALAETSLQEFASNRISTDKPLFQLMQTEIGECLRTGEQGDYECMGFLAFQENHDRLKQGSEAMRRLEELIVGSMSSAKSNFCLPRMKLLCNALMDLVEFLHRHNNLAPAEGLEKVDIQHFDMDAYLQKWPATPNEGTQPAAFGGG